MSGSADSSSGESFREIAESDHHASQTRSAGTEFTDAAPAEPMSREEYADYMRQGPAAGIDDHDPGEGYDTDATSGVGHQPDLDDPAEHAQDMSRSEYADYLRQGPAAATADGEVAPGSGDAGLPDAVADGRDDAGPGTQAEAPGEPLPRDQAWAAADNSLRGEQHQAGKPSEKSRPGHPDIHDRYPSDYKLALDAPPPRIDGPHQSPEKCWTRSTPTST
jgi:hypothetical protein